MSRIGVYRKPGRVALHLWWPGKVSVIVGDRSTAVRFALVVYGRSVVRWSY